jgi:hypothetical protein
VPRLMNIRSFFTSQPTRSAQFVSKAKPDSLLREHQGPLKICPLSTTDELREGKVKEEALESCCAVGERGPGKSEMRN